MSLKRALYMLALLRRVIVSLLTNPPAWLVNRINAGESLDGITCELCDDAQWWTTNGYSEGERQDACGPDGIDCPGFGGTP